jgi:hypothetical protein
MGFLCDCFGRRPRTVTSSKPGYARIVEASQPPSYSSIGIPIDLATLRSQRRSWATDAVNEDARLLSSHLIFPDEKEPLEPSVESAASSPRSSTVSLPNTLVTALTVTTDNTGASRGSVISHESRATIGAPPSYVSRRSASLQQSNRSSWDRNHPVLAEEWFDQFREP